MDSAYHWLDDPHPSPPSLEACCVRYLAKHMQPQQESLLPKSIVQTIGAFRGSINVFTGMHRGFVFIDPDWICIDSNCRFDWQATCQVCLNHLDKVESFYFAVINDLPSAGYFETMDRLQKARVMSCTNSLIQYAITDVRYSNHTEDSLTLYCTCLMAAACGWPKVIESRLLRYPDRANFDKFVSHLTLIAIKYRHYYMLETLPFLENGFTRAFVYIFPDGRVPRAYIENLVQCPPHAADKMNIIGRKLLSWLPKLDIERLKRQVVDTPMYETINEWLKK